jgi:hypothetical protein
MDLNIFNLLQLINETIASAIVIVAVSMLLYNLTRNRHNQVALTSSLVLGCITISYVCDVLVSLDPSLSTYKSILRLQWVGIAFLPVAMLHLSDALLSTTGLPSRGRRKRIIRFMYMISAAFLLFAAFTDLLINPIPVAPPHFAGVFVSVQAGILFPAYMLYFVIGTVFALINVGRARERCLTRDTRRRMGYLQIALLTPAFGIFPFSVLLGAGEEYSLLGLIVVNISNFIIILSLVFLSYPLSFFGTRVPDRVVKSELLRFFLRGPMTGLFALVTIFYITPATRIFGIPSQSFLPFAVVAVVMLWQWFIDEAIPHLERWLIYSGEEYERLGRLQSLSDRMLSRSDLVQLLEAVLAASSDYLRVSSAFIATLTDADRDVIATSGGIRPTSTLLIDEADSLRTQLAAQPSPMQPMLWYSWWIFPLHGRQVNEQITPPISGIFAIQARAPQFDLTDDDLNALERSIERAELTLADLLIQDDIILALEGLLPQMNLTAETRAGIEYRAPREGIKQLPASTLISDGEQFKEQVRAALRHFWGGPGLTNSRLLELHIVDDHLAENENNPVRALRAVLQKAIDAQKPEGERKYTSPEWTLYNILELRFIKGARVKDVGTRLAMSEADLYRKQRVALDAVAETLLEMERNRAV